MGRMKQPGCCDCGGSCLASAVYARKIHWGFFPILTSAQASVFPTTHLRYKHYECAFSRTDTTNFPTSTPITTTMGVSLEADISNVSNGEATYSKTEDGTTIGGSEINSAASAAMAVLPLGTRSTSGTYTFGTWTREETCSAVYDDHDGDTIVSIEYSDSYVETPSSPGPGGFFHSYEASISASVSTENPLSTVTAALADLLAESYDGSSHHGVRSIPIGTVGIVKYNEPEFIDLGTGIIRDTAAMAPNVGLPTIAVEWTVYHSDAGDNILDPYIGYLFPPWWQHPLGPTDQGESSFAPYSIYPCTFEDDNSFPRFAYAANPDNGVYFHSEYLFDVSPHVCTKFLMTVGSDTCSISTTTSQGELVNNLPYPSVVDNWTLEFVNAPLFTAPGYLSGGGCPCTNAP